MPGAAEERDVGTSSKLSLLQRLLLALPCLGRAPEDRTMTERLRSAILKPEDPNGVPHKPQKGPNADELEAISRSADDKERLIGLLGAPLAAAIGFIVVHTRVVSDPPARLRSGAIDKLHVDPSVYYDVFLVLIALSLLTLVMALFRKRLFLGMVLSLYGLAIFDLGYWGFGFPFVMVGAWLLVRAYRAQRALRDATSTVPTRAGDPRRRTAAPAKSPHASRRYTPRAVPPKRSSRPEKTKRAG